MIGTTLGQFRIIDKLGQGGMGVVYRAEDQKLGRQVALKVLHSEFVTDEERRKRFIREARTAAAVSHPHIASVHQIDEQDGVIFIAMELVEGKTLKTAIDGRPLHSDECLRLAMEITEGLARAHEAGIVHRDLKPENIIVGADEHAKILDFGLAKLYEDPDGAFAGETSGVQTVSAAVTREGRILGTVAYMSPEQARGLAVDARSDVFTFGIVLYEMATGKTPFQGETITDTLTAILRDEQPPVARFNPQIPVELERIMTRCLRKDPDERYQNAAEVLADLRNLKRISDSQPVPLVSDSLTGLRPGRPFLKQPLFWAAAVVLALVAGFGLPWMVRTIGRPSVVELAGGALAVLPFENLKDGDDPQRLGQILQELIIADLSELASTRVLSSQRLFDIQKQLGRDQRATIDRDMASEVSRRAGADTMLTGSLSELGDNMILTFQLVDVRDGTVIKSERLDGEDLYGMVDDLTVLVRKDLGADSTLAGPRDLAVKDRTSASLDAYQAYLGGVDLLNGLEFHAAVKQFEQAVEIDPSFGQAYYKLAIARWWSRSVKELEHGEASGDPGEELRALLQSEVKLSRKDRMLAEAFLALVEMRSGDALQRFEGILEKYPDEKEAWYGLGEARFHGAKGQGDRLAALGPFEKSIELDPHFSLAYYHIVDLYILDRRYDEGIRKVHDFIERDPENPAWYQSWTRAVVAKGDPAEIEAAIEESLLRIDDPDEQRSYLQGAAMTCRNEGDPERAERLLEQALAVESEEGDESIIAALGDVAVARGELDEAERLYLSVLDSRPGNQYAIKGLFTVLDRQRRYTDAIRLARGMTEEEPEAVAPYGYRLAAAIHSGDEDEAAEAWDAIESNLSAENLEPQAVEGLWKTRLKAHFDDSHHARVGELAGLALEGAPDSAKPALHVWLAWNALALGSLEDARNHLEAGRKLGPAMADLELASSRLATLQGDREGALRHAEQFAELVGWSPWSRVRIIETHLRNGDRSKAAELVRESAGAFTKEKEARIFHGELAMAYLGAGMLREAEEAALRSVGQQPRTADLDRLVTLGWAMMRRGKYAEARDTMRRGLQLQPQHAKLLYSVAVADMGLGENERAGRTLGRLLSEGPVLSEGYWFRAHALAAQGRLAEAEADARRAFEMSPNRGAHSLLAWVLVAGDIDVVRGLELAESAMLMPQAYYSQMVALPFTAPPEHSAGLALLALGRSEEAVEMLERAALARPDRPSIRTDLDRARPLVSRKNR